MNPPAADPGLLKLFLLVTFFLHIAAVNCLLGGAFLAGIARLCARRHPLYGRLSTDLAGLLPFFLAATLILGLAPLLFAKVLYGQAFHASSVIIAWPWLLVLILLLFAFYSLYFTASPRAKGTFLVMSFLLLTAIAFTFTTNISLMQESQQWEDRYPTDEAMQETSREDTALLPRFTHFLIASLAIGGLMSVVAGFFRWRKDPDYGRFMIRFGGRWFLWSTAAQFLSGIWFLLCLPRKQMLLFLGKDLPSTLLMVLSILGGFGALIVMSRALRSEDPRPKIKLALGIGAITVMAMVITRDLLRDSYLEPFIKPSDVSLENRWCVLVLFLGLLLGGAALWVLMLRRCTETEENFCPKRFKN
jgi:hypothetical protein